MGFMNSYKRLDNLCKDRNGVGITGYIEEMEGLPEGKQKVSGWLDDYKMLKHYRYIRNQLAHEADVEEADLCTAKDTAWLEAFYERIMVQRDPLAKYHNKLKPIKKRNERDFQEPVGEGAGSQVFFYLFMGAVAILLILSLLKVI